MNSKKDPKNINLSSLKSFAIDSIKDNSYTDLPLYLAIQNEAVVYASGNYYWTKKELERLLQDGHRFFYYDSSDAKKVEMYLHLTQMPKVDENLIPSRRIVQISDVAANLTRHLYEFQMSAQALAMMDELSGKLVTCIREDLCCIQALTDLQNHDDYTYYHSSRVAALSLAIAIKESLEEETELQEMGLGCLLHDIGKSKIKLELLNKPGALTQTEIRTMRAHPHLGFEILENSEISAIPRLIVMHHHERIHGGGYPDGIDAKQLPMEVRITAFADVFDALTTTRPYQISRSRFEALDFIKSQLLTGLDSDAYKALIDILATPRVS